MSLEAIAAMLGHRSPRMTLVYARIRTTRSPSSTSEPPRPSRPSAPHSRSTRGDVETREHRRLLGNGHCTRPALLDCRYQTICEGCGFFETGPEFVSILRRQRDSAEDLADFERAKIYTELVDGLTTDKTLSRGAPAAETQSSYRPRLGSSTRRPPSVLP